MLLRSIVSLSFPAVTASADPATIANERETIDRNNTTHLFEYDVVGRPTVDRTAPPAGIDPTVKRLETAYNSAGRAYLFTSYSATFGGTVVNQVQRDFNGLGQTV